MDKINILHIYPNSKTGGIQNQILNLLKVYDRETFTPHVCCFGPKMEMGRAVEGLGVDFIAFNREDYRNFSPRLLMNLYKLIKDRHIHIIRSHNYRANLYGLLAGRLAGVPVIASVHNVYTDKDKSRKRKMINRLLFKIADSLVAVSDAIKNDVLSYLKIDPLKITVIYNGVDTARFDPERTFKDIREELSIGKDDILIGFIGRLVNFKGVEHLIKAVALLKDEFGGMKLLIVGDGPVADALQKKTAALNISGITLFTGNRNDIPDILSSIDILAIPSVGEEGFPNTLVEAMAMGKPVIATTVGGITEVIEDRVTGLLVPPGEPLRLAAALKTLITNRELSSKMGLDARRVVREKFGIRATAEKWESMYKTVLCRKDSE
jgi:glycosyltransferase involved in cell wall biosynthesis